MIPDLKTINQRETTLLSKIIATISNIFLPIMNVLCAAGIMKSVLLLLVTASILSDTSDTYLILKAISDSTFYFLPVLLAFTSAKAFKANPFYCAVISLILLYPSLTEAFQGSSTLHFFNLPIKAVPYQSSILPIIMASALLSICEHFLENILPDVLKIC
ncbi:MAG: beta-glucoside system component [Clostridiales bacterium]|nr:beta-glucoside system component [Clostridiales bacterium]